MDRAFVLGAGMGNRLRPLTLTLPKPLIPVWQRPLIAFAFAHLRGIGVRRFVVNTHHLPGKYAEAFPAMAFGECPVAFRHEPVLLETGGGLANVADLLGEDAPFAVYNGDILTDLPLAPAWRRHLEEQNLATLILRSRGQVKNVAFDPDAGRVLDLRNALGTCFPNQVQFTGIYFVSPAFFRRLVPGKIESVVEGFLRAIVAGEKIGGIVIDEGDWWDLGDRTSYLVAHGQVCGIPMAHLAGDSGWNDPVHSSARVAASAQLDGLSCIGAGAEVGAGAVIRNSLVWPNARVEAGAVLTNCIVRSGQSAAGCLSGADV